MTARLVKTAAAAAALLAGAAPAAAWDEIVVKRGWPIVAEAQDEGCSAQILGNGQIYRIAGAGLGPGEVVRFHLENEDIKPIEYRIVADQSGRWTKFYMPFLWNRAGGTVSVELASASCSLSLSFPWQRQTAGNNSRLGEGGY